MRVLDRPVWNGFFMRKRFNSRQNIHNLSSSTSVPANPCRGVYRCFGWSAGQADFPLFVRGGERGAFHRRGRANIHRFLPGRYRRDDRPFSRSNNRRDLRASEQRHYPDAANRGRHLGWRGTCSGDSALKYWQFTLTATDANRFAIRMARHITGRPKILVFNYCYHGSVDETFISLDEDGVPGPRRWKPGRRRSTRSTRPR